VPGRRKNFQFGEATLAAPVAVMLPKKPTPIRKHILNEDEHERPRLPQGKYQPTRSIGKATGRPRVKRGKR
jgi:hypothetical protein